ncbi:MAG: LamG domain-containing protein, partial [Chloroflexi bacterium]|nr:LamG domain-containing protein [Chloroflexota bacterium]
HGHLLGTRQSKRDTGAIAFLEYQDTLELKPLRLGAQWTIVVEAHFPLKVSSKPHVLASGGFKQDHIQVNESGMLGICANTFIESGYNVNALKGWQRMTVVAYNGQTYFYVGEEGVGIAKGICKEPLQSLGNSTGSGSPWGGAIRAVMVWRRPMSQKEMQTLPTPLTLKP